MSGTTTALHHFLLRAKIGRVLNDFRLNRLGVTTLDRISHRFGQSRVDLLDPRMRTRNFAVQRRHRPTDTWANQMS